MLTRLVRIQLAIFAIASMVGIPVMVVNYMQVSTLLGIGRITVKMELPAAGGLYRFSNVTYRGVQVGKVTGIRLARNSAEATMSLNTSPKIPADLQAQVHSVSAVGEQYVDLLPRTESGPYLRDGSRISMRDITIPQPISPMLDRVSSLIASIPGDKLAGLLEESFKAFNGAGYDLGSFMDSAAKISHDANGVAGRTRTLIDDSRSFLDSQAQSGAAIRLWAHSLAGVTEQTVMDDPQIRKLLDTGPGSAQEVARLLNQVKPTLPVLLANLRTIGQIGVTYNPSLEQLLVLLPPYVAATAAAGGWNNPTGLPLGDFAVSMEDPPPCTVGFLPPSAWRSADDTSEIDTPDGLYCKLPQDSPSSVRGARNYPCMGHPGKRAPTVEICNSDKPYEPLAIRQHVLGPYPLDPNLLSQGIPPDDRINSGERIFGPVDGTPLPPGSPPVTGPGQASPPRPDASYPAPPEGPPPGKGPGDGVPATPSAFTPKGSRRAPVAIARYDPQTGHYLAPDGRLYQQSDLVTDTKAKSWKDMMLPS
ncbi:MCE family protein [Mycobacterium sp. SMC-2]|uniref:MCE family protein n=1 Tax=Mycobacterium sp. SMC-2 TaxID=2857058 RepID=UPI0021B24B7E|nr:MlaD family protein [Mycobacterium sp. SMC-2]UXA06153.1 MCE family protein [Mycobacterium sp. SMC-2]